MSAREEVARLLLQHAADWDVDGYGLYLAGCKCGWGPAGPDMAERLSEHQADVLMAEDWIDDRPVPCGSEAYIPSDYYRTENYGWVRCGGYLGEGHVHEDSNTGYQWDDEGSPLR